MTPHDRARLADRRLDALAFIEAFGRADSDAARTILGGSTGDELLPSMAHLCHQLIDALAQHTNRSPADVVTELRDRALRLAAAGDEDPR